LETFVEAEIRPDGIEFTKVPIMLVVRKSLSKARHQYFTFVPQQTITYINEYLEERVKQGWFNWRPYVLRAHCDINRL